MPRTKLQEATRWVSLTDFAQYYNISKSQASRVLKKQEFDCCKRRLGEKTIRVELYQADKIIQQIFR